jgi:hypothetical protein
MEAGSASVLEFGVGNIPTDDAASLLAFQRWCAQRTDVSTPIIPAGGQGPLWIALLMRPVPRNSEMQAPAPIIVYSGAIEAEYLATVTLLHTANTPSDPAASRTAAIPTSHFVPSSQPGMSISWDAALFLEPHDQPAISRAEVLDNENLPEQGAQDDPIQDWLAWAALLLALFLVLLAVAL